MNFAAGGFLIIILTNALIIIIVTNVTTTRIIAITDVIMKVKVGSLKQTSPRRASQRLAYEQQRAAAEAEHRRFLERNGKVAGPGAPSGTPGGPGGPPGTPGGHAVPGGRGYTELPSVLGRPGSYRVQRGHRNMQKTDSGENLYREF